MYRQSWPAEGAGVNGLFLALRLVLWSVWCFRGPSGLPAGLARLHHHFTVPSRRWPTVFPPFGGFRGNRASGSGAAPLLALRESVIIVRSAGSSDQIKRATVSMFLMTPPSADAQEEASSRLSHQTPGGGSSPGHQEVIVSQPPLLRCETGAAPPAGR